MRPRRWLSARVASPELSEDFVRVDKLAALGLGHRGHQLVLLFLAHLDALGVFGIVRQDRHHLALPELGTGPEHDLAVDHPARLDTHS